MHWVGPKVDIALADIWFQLATLVIPGVHPIRVYINYILPGKKWEVREHVTQLIEHLLGEKVAAMNIELLEVDSRCNASKKQKLLPLSELPDFVKSHSGSMKIGKDGRLTHIINEP